MHRALKGGTDGRTYVTDRVTKGGEFKSCSVQLNINGSEDVIYFISPTYKDKFILLIRFGGLTFYLDKEADKLEHQPFLNLNLMMI